MADKPATQKTATQASQKPKTTQKPKVEKVENPVAVEEPVVETMPSIDSLPLPEDPDSYDKVPLYLQTDYPDNMYENKWLSGININLGITF